MATLLLLAAPMGAQGPAAAWRTVETAHFRVHYPAAYEEWALRAASRLESVRSAVSAEIGFTPSQTIDVLVANPVAEPNGSAWPLLDTPRMVLWAEPPGPGEQLGAYSHWIELLSVHETAHLVHMLRPSRNPLTRWLERSVLPLNRVTRNAPRWVLEGYATVVEGRLTGAGRPSSTMRALVLRRWAESGRMPTYAQLDSDRRFLGMSMAYLAGSAYLEWLEQRAGEGALRNVWSRMTARHSRSFDDAFAGVFGDRPERLYGQFAAEVSASAVAIRRGGALREGELFQDTSAASGDPAVSPDGSKIAFVIRAKRQPSKLVVWSTSPPVEEEKKFNEQLAKILQADPEDVGPVRAKPLPRKPLHELVLGDGGDLETPRWMPDGKSIVFSHRMPDADGVLHFDLFAWDFERVRRITHLADVRDADPLPGGDRALAIRSRFGASQLVRVDLATGAVSPRGEASIDRVLANPRVSPDGSLAAWIEHAGGAWTLRIEDERSAVSRRLPLPGEPAALAWSAPDALTATVLAGGFAELYRVPLEGEATQLTRTTGGAFDPAPSPDGRIFFTALAPDGYALRVLSPAAGPVAPWQFSSDASLIPAVPPAAGPAIAFTPGTLSASRPYGIGRQELAWFAGQNFAPEQRSTEAGARLGDVVGRFDALLLGSFAGHGLPEGAALVAAWRGWPVELGLHAWTATADKGDHEGVELRAGWDRRFGRADLSLDGGGNSNDRWFARGAFAARQVRETWSIDERIDAEMAEGRQRFGAAIGLRAGALRLRVEADHASGDPISLGGMATSLLPHSAYLDRVLDPALPPGVLAGDGYDGLRFETTVPGVPVTAFYQRHETGDTAISLAGAELQIRDGAVSDSRDPGGRSHRRRGARAGRDGERRDEMVARNAVAALTGAMAPPCRLVRFAASDGVELSGLLFEPKRATKRAAIFVHGTGGASVFDAKRTNLLADRFVREGLAWFAFDNRGAHLVRRLKARRGTRIRSVMGGMAHEKIREAIHDLDGAIAELYRRGYRDVTLVGHSTGANKIAVYDHYRPGNRARRYVFLGGGDDTGLLYDRLGARRFADALVRARGRITAGRGDELVPPSLFGLPLSWHSFLDMANPDGDYNVFPFVEGIRGIRLARRPFRFLKGIRKPSLVIYGENDEYCFGDVSRCASILATALNDRLNFELAVMSNAGHGFSGCEEELGDVIAAWMGGRDER